MIYFFKPLPSKKLDLNIYQPFIKNQWFSRHFMKLVYALQVILFLWAALLKIWSSLEWWVQIPIFIIVFVVHELLHGIVVYKIGDISVSFSKGFLWITSNAVMSKARFLLFMSLPFLVLTVLPVVLLLMAEGKIQDILAYIACYNAILAGADILNSILILPKPARAKFCQGHYTVSVILRK